LEWSGTRTSTYSAPVLLRQLIQSTQNTLSAASGEGRRGSGVRVRVRTVKWRGATTHDRAISSPDGVDARRWLRNYIAPRAWFGTWRRRAREDKRRCWSWSSVSMNGRRTGEAGGGTWDSENVVREIDVLSNRGGPPPPNSPPLPHSPPLALISRSHLRRQAHASTRGWCEL
jgi:hypothetical protein